MRGKVVVVFVFPPVKIGEQVFGFLEGVGDIALRDAQSLGEKRGHQIAVRVVADDQVRLAAKFGQDDLFRVDRKPLQVGPDMETGNPLRHDRAVSFGEGDANDAGVAGAVDVLFGDVATGLGSIRDLPGDDQNIRFRLQALFFETVRISFSRARTWSRM